MPCRRGRPAMNSRRRASRHSAPSPASRPAESESMFERLERVIPDPILGLMAAFRADPDPRKVDLGVGVYRDDRGETPVLEAVRRAESALLARQSTKSYVGPAGNPAFNEAIERLVLGEEHEARLTARVRTVQAPGGCGALRLGAELIRAVSPDSVVHVSTPTWANHSPLLSGSGLKLAPYPYFDPATGGVQFAAMAAALGRLPARAVVLLHACCHNPTGADLSPAQWRELLELVKRRQLMPFIDMAYQGLGEGLEADAYGIRLLSPAGRAAPNRRMPYAPAPRPPPKPRHAGSTHRPSCRRPATPTRARPRAGARPPPAGRG